MEPEPIDPEEAPKPYKDWELVADAMDYNLPPYAHMVN
jgi:hypothetical protein